jgi:hypothetical protein
VNNLYIVVRESLDVELHLVARETVNALVWSLDYAYGRNMRDPRTVAARATFGMTALNVLQVWPVEAAIAVAEQYQGPAQDQVRAMAALVALGEPIPEDCGKRGKGGDGGARDRVPAGPAPMSPSPAKVGPG